MKYVKLFSLLFITVVFAGCSEEDNEENFRENLIGRWYRLGTPGTTSFSFFNHACPENKDYREFLPDGTGVLKSFNTNCQAYYNQTFNWSVQDGELSVSHGGYSGRIVSLNKNELIIESTFVSPDYGAIVTSYVFYR